MAESLNRSKRAALDAWVKAVNAKGGFGIWCWDVAFEPAKVYDILNLHAKPLSGTYQSNVQ